MTDSVARVRPGDLIRAEDINLMLDLLANLNERVIALEDGKDPNAPRITAITPELPRVGDEMRIRGTNLGFSTGLSPVRFDTTAVSAYKPGTSDTELIFTVPEIPGLPVGGRAVLLQVSNAKATTTRTITVLPKPPILQGDIDLLYDGPQPATPVAGQDFVLNYRLNSRANLPATLTVIPTLSVPTWSMQVADATGQPNPSRQFTVLAGKQLAFSIRMQIPAGTAAGTAFSVAARAEGAGIVADGGSQSFTIGQTAPVPDPDIELAVDGATPPSALSGTTVTAASGDFVELAISAAFRKVGTYHVSPSSVDGWQASTNLSGNKIVISASDIGGDQKAHSVFSVFVGRTGAAVAGDLTIVVQREGATQDRRLVFHLKPA
ncbi:hypothetical protein [Amycolatopsis sp. NPDC054798]